MPINQFNFKPKGFGINQETTGTVKTGSDNYYNDYYYRSPEYDRLTGGIGASNSSYGLRNTTNSNRLDPNKELYERTLGELISTLVGNSDTTRINKYIAPTVKKSSQTSVTNTTPKTVTSAPKTTTSTVKKSSQTSVTNTTPKTVTSAPKTTTSTVKKSSTTSRTNKPMGTGGGGSANKGAGAGRYIPYTAGNMSFNTSGITKSRQPLIVGLINALMSNTPTSTNRRRTIGNKNKGSSRRISHR